MEINILWTCALLIIFLGCFNTKSPDDFVTVRNGVHTWKGSCVRFPCTHKTKDGKKTINIVKYAWLYNATYDKQRSEYNGTVVYNSVDNNEVDQLFADHVKYVGDNNVDCTILLRNIRKEHEGIYSVRLWEKELRRWMSKNILITVSDTGPPLNIHLPPKIIESQSITLNCSILSCCHFNTDLYWTNEVNGTTEIRREPEGLGAMTSLMFRPSWHDHKKNITCILLQDNIEIRNATVQLNVMYAPKNVQVFPNETIIKIKKEKPLTLNCSVESSNPDSEITWFKDNVPQRQSRAKTIRVNNSGKYSCKAKNAIGESTSNQVEVSVLYAPDKPVINTSPAIIKEGTHITMQCVTKANPPVSRYIWFKNEEECYNHTSDRFIIDNIKEDHSGSYTCFVYNELGHKQSDVLNLDVVYAPRYPKIVLEVDTKTFIQEDKIIFVEGDNVIFKCNINSSNPPVSGVNWYKNGKGIKNLIKAVKAEDAGDYTCEAENSVGRTKSPIVKVDIHYPPKGVDILVPKKDVKENDIFRLKCQSNASKPKVSRYEWYKDGVLLRNSSSDVMDLRFEWTHTGDYLCKAVNDIGPSASTKKRITVQYAPRNVTLTVSPGDHVTEHTDVILSCTGKGYPAVPYYQFYLNDLLLSSGGDSADLRDVQIKDSGEYSCLARNLLGDGRSNVISLHVSHSLGTIGKFASIGASSLIALLILIILIVRFRVSIRKALRRKTVDDNCDSTFFVLKKSHESADNMGRQTSSRHSSTDVLNYSVVNHASKRRINPPSAMADNDITTIYSVVRKVPNAAEYENLDSSKTTHEDHHDELHYSVIANLKPKATERERDPEVEYAKLRHS